MATVKRYRPPKVAATLTHDGPGRTAVTGLKVGDYIEANIDGKVGSGYRFYLITRVYPRKKEVRLFYVPTLVGFDYSTEALLRNPTLRKLDDRYTTRLIKRIKENRRDYTALPERSAKDAKEALAVLRS